MFQEYEMVKLRHDLPKHNMKAGTRGAIVMVHHIPNRAYEVELIDKESGNWAVATLKDEDLVADSSNEVSQNQAA